MKATADILEELTSLRRADAAAREASVPFAEVMRRAAAAPAHLYTKKIPATPLRLLGSPSADGAAEATSSPATTLSTRMSSSMSAISAAMSKLKMSPL